MFIDELESNLNKSIINDIIKLFYSKITNPFGAVLIFSTHYSELLDFVRRNDSIVIFEKGRFDEKAKCISFAKVVNRNDLKKSEAFISNSLSISSTPQKSYIKELQLKLVSDMKELPLARSK